MTALENHANMRSHGVALAEDDTTNRMDIGTSNEPNAATSSTSRPNSSSYARGLSWNKVRRQALAWRARANN